jgi:transposase-like protein
MVMVGDGALGMWSALGEVFPETRVQRCWVHYVEDGIMWSACSRDAVSAAEAVTAA